LHELATTIGNTWLLCGLGALGAGLAAIALMSGVAKIKRSTTLSKNFPADAEACVDKYVLPFNQLDQKAIAINELAEKMKGQPAAHLSLTAFAMASGETESVAKAKDAATTDDEKKGRGRK
jgi:hypothetical protein